MSKKHIVRTGEGISSIAADYGFAPDTLWNHPENAALKAQRRDGNVLRKGDELIVPDKAAKTVSCAVDQLHRFRRRGVPPQIRIRFVRDGEPDADRDYELYVEGRLVKADRTDADGWIFAFVPPTARRGEIRFLPPRPMSIPLDLGGLDPGDGLRGLEQRLANLRLLRRPVRGVRDEALEDAVRAFQAREGLPETGELDEITKSTLLSVHDDPT